MASKERLSQLAVFGSPPSFDHKLHVGRPNIGSRNRLLERMEKILDSRWLTNGGPQVREFESRIAERVGVKHCIATCNATQALEIAARAVGFAGEVIVPSFTFVATVHALHWQGIIPAFCDMDPETFHLDPKRVEACITPRTTGILGVHLWGRACPVDALEAMAEKHGLALIFDAAHGFACSHGGRMIGGFGRAEVFSFHATKCLNTFEGGAVTTNDDALSEKVRLMTNFGFSGYDRVVEVGTNAKMSEVSAAMGLTGLESLEEFTGANRRNYHRYLCALRGISGIKMMTYDESEQSNYHYIILEIDEKITGISRDRLMEVLHAENVLARRYFYPGSHRMEPYGSIYPTAWKTLPATERTVKRVLSLPTGSAVGDSEIDRIAEIIRLAATRGREISRRLCRRRGGIDSAGTKTDPRHRADLGVLSE